MEQRDAEILLHGQGQLSGKLLFLGVFWGGMSSEFSLLFSHSSLSLGASSDFFSFKLWGFCMSFLQTIFFASL